MGLSWVNSPTGYTVRICSPTSQPGRHSQVRAHGEHISLGRSRVTLGPAPLTGVWPMGQYKSHDISAL